MSDDTRPLTIDVPDAAIDDLRDRLARTRWPEAETVDDWSQGIPLSYTQELCDYWASDYDWRRFESALNAYDNFVTEIDGLDIHFIHVKSKEPDALPMVLTHGWPGSIVEFQKVIGPLTDPVAHGGKAASNCCTFEKLTDGTLNGSKEGASKGTWQRRQSTMVLALSG
jgi:hypothetical protein